ncbi:MAG: hypothetical protein J6M42_04865 [Clostridia bacterium]|nr:hypothetical protein [Clostridia bacterium]
MTKRIIAVLLCLLLLTLTATGCQDQANDPPPLMVLDPDSIHEVADLTCSVYMSGETKILTGEKVYELYRLLFQAMAEAETAQFQSRPDGEPHASISFYVEGETTDPPETTSYGFLVSNTQHYGFFGVYQSGYFTFSLSPLHSYADAYQGEEGLYEEVMSYFE